MEVALRLRGLARLGTVGCTSRLIRVGRIRAISIRRTVALILSAAPLLSGCDSSLTFVERIKPTPTLFAPERGAVLQNACTLDPIPTHVWDFDWSDVATASQYQLFVKNETAPQPAVDVSDLAESRYHGVLRGYIINANLDGWTWKVRALVGDRWGPWSEDRAFSVERLNASCLQP